MKIAIKKSSNFLKRLQQMYPVYESDLRVRTEIEESLSLPDLHTAARISDFSGTARRAHGTHEPRFLWAYRASPIARREDPS